MNRLVSILVPFAIGVLAGYFFFMPEYTTTTRTVTDTTTVVHYDTVYVKEQGDAETGPPNLVDEEPTPEGDYECPDDELNMRRSYQTRFAGDFVQGTVYSVVDGKLVDLDVDYTVTRRDIFKTKLETITNEITTTHTVRERFLVGGHTMPNGDGIQSASVFGGVRLSDRGYVLGGYDFVHNAPMFGVAVSF